MIIRIDQDLIKPLFPESKSRERQRINYNFHQENRDTLQRMLNVLQPGTYIQPHRHLNPPKREVFIILKGSLIVATFDDSGNLNDSMLLNHKDEQYAAEIQPGIWHSIVPLEENTVVYELKDGPYDPSTDKEFAPWAPDENSNECFAFNRNILEKLMDKQGE